jgi:PST family polysaccharide transporter
VTVTLLPSAAATAPPSGDAGLTRRTLAGLAWTAGGKAVYAGLRLLVLFILARLVAPADFGVVGAAAVVMGFSTIFSQLGMAPAIVQRPVLEPRHEQAAFSASVGFGLMLGAMLWLLAPAIATAYHIAAVQPVLRTFAWTFPLAGLSAVGDAMMQRELRFKWLATVEVVSFVVGYGIVGVTLALLRYGVWALVAAEMSKTGLYTAILVVSRPQRFTLRPERRAFAELMYYGSGFTLSKIANYLALQLDNVIVGRWMGAAALGFYGRAYELMAGAPALLGEPVDKVLFPAMAARQGDLRSLASAYQRGVAAMALITLPLSTVLCGLAPEAIPVLLGPKWTPVVVPFQILTLGMFLRTSYRISDVVARATGAVYRRAWRQTVYMLCVIVGAWFGRRLGIAGVAFGVLGALAVNYLLMANLGLQLSGLGWRRFWGAHVHPLLVAGVAGAATWGLAALLRGWSLPPATILAIVVMIELGAALLLVRVAPRAVLGEHGEWMLNRLRESVPWGHASRRSARPAAESPKPEPLRLVHQLATALEDAGIRYCQRNSQVNCTWATGAGDIDLRFLVDAAHAERFSGVLTRLGFAPVLDPPRQRLPGVHSFLGLDRATGGLVRVHAHQQVLVGRPWSASYALGIEGPLLSSATPNAVFRTPAPEFELIETVIRTVERYGLTNALRPRDPDWAESVRQESSRLEARIDQFKLARALEQVPLLDARFFEQCRRSLRPDYPRWRRVLLRQRLLQRLRTGLARPPIAAALTTPLRRARALAPGRPDDARTRFVSGGMIIALDGADGAGKSSCARELVAWLSPTFECAWLQMGEPRRSLLTVSVDAALRAGTLFDRLVGRSRTPVEDDIGSGRAPSYLELLRHVCTARDRRRLALEAQRRAARGAVVVCERYPNVTPLAGPTIQHLRYPVPRGWVGRWLVRAETGLYDRIPPPDLVAVLLVDPEHAVERKRDEPAAHAWRRTDLVTRADRTGTGAHVVDANRPLREVVRDLKCLIWSAVSGAPARRYGLWPGRLRTQPVIVELVGPAGAGKSTVADALAGRDDTRRVSVWGLPLLLWSWSAVRLVPTFLLLCLDSRGLPWRAMKYMIRLGALHQLLSHGAAQRHRLIVLDEGPAFVLSWLRVFGAARLLRSAAYERWVQRTLIAWVRVLDVVVSLDAPDPVLAQRIRSRAKPHVIRHQSDQQIAAFTARFRTAFAAVIPAITSLNGTKHVTLPAEAQDPQAVAAHVLQGIEGLSA